MVEGVAGFGDGSVDLGPPARLDEERYFSTPPTVPRTNPERHRRTGKPTEDQVRRQAMVRFARQMKIVDKAATRC
jgi:hypothetical protein